MKNKIITGFGSVIALLYTVLIVLAVDGLGRAGIINGVMDLLGFENVSIYGVILFTVCLVILVFWDCIILDSHTIFTLVNDRSGKNVVST